MGCPVKTVKANIDRRILTTIEVEDVADAAITFENGAVYSFFACNYYTHNSDIRIELNCEKGTILLTGDAVDIRIEGGETRHIPMVSPQNAQGESYWGSCHQIQIAKFYQALAEGTPVPIDPRDALKTLALVQAIYTSAKENRTIICE